jgi:type I restriction-modification system DNA methylase subunit
LSHFTIRQTDKTTLLKTNKIIDSACGSGGFLIEALKKVEMLIDTTGTTNA